MKSSKFFLKAIAKLGVENVFGIVGGEAQAIQFDEAEDIKFYLTRHEFVAGVMADTYSRITGKPQMCYSTFGPGLTNLSTGACSAILDRSPVLVVSAQIPRSEICFNQTHQCIDNVAFMKTLTKYAVEINNVLEIPEILTRALTIAVSDIPGPVYISFPLDVMKEDIDDKLAYQLLNELKPIAGNKPPKLNQPSLDAIVEKIKKAQHPLIIAGNQVIRAKCCEVLLKLVTEKNIPILATLASKGVIPEDHPLFITPGNKYIDEIYQQPLTDKIFEDCDLILLIGYDFGEDLKSSLWKNKIETIVINEFYNDMGKVFQPNTLYQGDLLATLEYLCASDIVPKEISKNLNMLKKIFDKRLVYDQGKSTDISTIMEAIRNALGKTGILCSDIGLHKQYAGLLTKTYTPNTFICSNVCGTFGFGLPAGLGAKLAKPNERVCVICGDGGFHSTSQDLETAVRYNIPIIIIVLKDNAFGLIKYYQLLTREAVFPSSVEFGNVDFVKLAEANGMGAAQLTDVSRLEEVMNEAFSGNKPYLIEIPINYRYKL